MPASVTVCGAGLRLSEVDDLASLARRLRSAPAPAEVRRFAAPDTVLAPVEREVYGPVEPRVPARAGTRGLRSLPHESLLALGAAASTPGKQGPDDTTAVVWASSTAGLPEYATVCAEASTLEPGFVAPALGPASAHNGPAATVSIRLGLAGPNLTLTGGATAGISAIAEAMRLIAAGDARAALVGASATVTRWSLTAAQDHLTPAEGAACLVLDPAGGSGIQLGECHRTDLVRATARVIQAAARPQTRPDGLVVSTSDFGLVDALASGQPFPVWHVERALGDLGAAGGFLAVVGAAALCAATGPLAAPRPLPDAGLLAGPGLLPDAGLLAGPGLLPDAGLLAGAGLLAAPGERSEPNPIRPTKILALAVEPCGSTASLEVSSS
ncbi:beta-ketoacyl synthase N-terminal-like domain-containing protein [Phytohabitans sp. ZYX-F-186]|uniref:Beta-ketoacyl synthase N-terminal-like domain-containing protein n=1 Tax=Phytohabitans maris TaxID=3071409 RepID=A0ABU0Z9J9_9ACTN|nr:beta-ketoacyl synthase N-terminal-like domain-containing protein [Phytohabitans sp. ZYX-F-186]MDQ7903002.1 beta-ketoacyl synthase N-terminal-like domain-containing protein [Phytohabitans sp. ZYX-F-186]